MKKTLEKKICPFLKDCKEEFEELTKTGITPDKKNYEKLTRILKFINYSYFYKEFCPKDYTKCAEYKIRETAIWQADIIIKKFYNKI